MMKNRKDAFRTYELETESATPNWEFVTSRLCNPCDCMSYEILVDVYANVVDGYTLDEMGLC